MSVMPLTNSYLNTILVHMLWHSGELHILAPLALLFVFAILIKHNIMKDKCLISKFYMQNPFAIDSRIYSLKIEWPGQPRPLFSSRDILSLHSKRDGAQSQFAHYDGIWGINCRLLCRHRVIHLVVNTVLSLNRGGVTNANLNLVP